MPTSPPHANGRIPQGLVFGFALFLLPLFYFHAALLGKVALVQGDGWTANLGLRILTGQLIRQGTLPLWDPYIFAGMPLFASIYPGVLYPPNWLFAMLPVSLAMTLVVVTTYHIAIIGAYLYSRAIGLSRSGALLAGIVFTFGGYMVMSMGQTSNIAAAAWIGWLLLAIEKLYNHSSWRWVALGACFIALQFFAGVPQITFYTALVCGAYVIFSVILRARREKLSRFSLATAVMACAAALLCMVQLLPLIELQRLTVRAGIGYESFSQYPFPPQQVIALVIPYFFGGAALPPYHLPYRGESGIFETCGYVGIGALLLAGVALIGGRRNSVVRFWCGIALVSLLLSFGPYLPFESYRALYHLPVYNLFRASFRHMFEFTFALGVLAGWGLTSLSEGIDKQKGTAIRMSIAAFGLVVTGAAIAYRWMPTAATGPSAQPHSFSNAEILVPLTLFAMSAVAIWLFARHRSMVTTTLIMTVLLLDLVAYGHFLDWRTYTFPIGEKRETPPSVKFIKEHERDLNSFRILSDSQNPFGSAYEMLAYPNLSIAYGLQSVNGYDMLQLERASLMMGGMTHDGVVRDQHALDASNETFNLLNVRFLLRERLDSEQNDKKLIFNDVTFDETPLARRLRPGDRLVIQGNGMADSLALISTMGNSAHIGDGSPVLKIRLKTTDGRELTSELQAGRDVSEWAWDRADLKTAAKHKRARVAESWDAGGFQGHRYFALLPFERSQVESIELEYAREDAEIEIVRASLFDRTSKVSIPLSDIGLSPERWLKLANFGAVDVYWNRKAMPRAWLVNSLREMSDADALRTIETGKFPDGAKFDPLEVALIDKGESDETTALLSGQSKDASVQVTAYGANRIDLRTLTGETRLLVLSEIYYPGWEAEIDSRPARVVRTNYALRGVVIPAGDHAVRFVFRSKSLRKGAILSGLGVILLCLVATAGSLRRRARRV